MKDDCIFCKIVAGSIPCYNIWEDEKHLAFLTIFPNTPGFTVVIPKEHYGSYIFDIPEDVMLALIKAAKKVAKLLDSRLEEVGRTGMIFEGFGVDHLHAKLFPMHGTKIGKWDAIHSNVDKFFDKYEGYISTQLGPKANFEELKRLAEKIRNFK